MSTSKNSVSLIGNVGKDPEVRVTNNNEKVATFTLATSDGGYTKPDGTNVPEKTQWHNIVAWRGVASLIEKCVHKGDRVCVEGKITYRDYEKDGVKRYVTEIIALDIVLCSNKPGNGQQPQQQNNGYQPQNGGYAPNGGYPQQGYQQNQGYQPQNNGFQGNNNDPYNPPF